MADPLREALAAMADQWARFGRGDPLDPWTAHAADLRDLLAAHPEPAEPPAPEGAVRVRIAVAVLDDGRWSAFARRSQLYSGGEDEERARHGLGVKPGLRGTARLSWVEAWVPRPEAEQVVEGRVEEGE